MAIYPSPGQLVDDTLALGAAACFMSLPWWAQLDPPTGFSANARWVARHMRAVHGALTFLRGRRHAIVMTNTMTIPSLAVAARLARLPHLWMVHEFGIRDHGLEFPLGYARTMRLISSLSQTVICCSRAVEESLRDVCPSMKTRVIYYGIESPELGFRPRGRGSLHAVLVGRFSESKGQRIAVEALALARRQGADLALTLVGSGEASEVERLANALGVERYVRCRPHTPTPIDVWREADVALMCSRDEAFGRVTVEAMRASLPVCGADSGGTREIVIDGVNGLLFPPGDSRSLASKLVRLASDEVLRGRLAEGAARSTARFGVDRYRQELREAVLIAGSRSRL